MLLLKHAPDIAPRAIDWNGLTRRFLHPGELETLIELADSVHPRRAAEFGCHDGRTARAMLNHVSTLEEYIGVEVPRHHKPQLHAQRREVPRSPGHLALGDCRFKLVVKPRGTQDLRAEDLGELDFCFIDGDHSREVVNYDTYLARRAVRPGGMIVWHDYHDMEGIGVRDVLHAEMAAGHDIRHVRGTWIAFERVGSGELERRD